MYNNKKGITETKDLESKDIFLGENQSNISAGEQFSVSVSLFKM